MIRRVLRVLGSRYGIAAILLFLVVAVVVIAGTEDESPAGTADRTESSVEPGAPDDGLVTEPSASTTGDPVGPDSSLPDAAVDVAASFAAEWIAIDRSPQEWRAALAPLSTESLVEQLSLTDPVAVPARELRGDPVPRNGLVEFDTDAGLLILRVTAHDGTWYVDGVDFVRP